MDEGGTVYMRKEMANAMFVRTVRVTEIGCDCDDGDANYLIYPLKESIVYYRQSEGGSRGDVYY